MRFSAAVGFFSILSAVAGGCDGCNCGGKTGRAVGSHLKTPDEPTFKKLFEDALPQRPDLWRQLCGIPVGGLRDLEMKFRSELSFLDVPGFRTAEVRAKPIPGDAGSLPEALVCIGVLTLMASPILDDAGNVKDWKLSKITVDEVKTPGHEWKRPPSGDD